jgi:hypothetical protein
MEHVNRCFCIELVDVGYKSTYTLPVVLDSSPVQLASGVYPLLVGNSLYFPHTFFCVGVDSI